jgi:hypothetical protein
MAWKPMEPHERASIEAQVILKGAVELTASQIAAGTIDPNEDILDTLNETAIVLTNVLGDVKTQLGAAPVDVAVAVAKVETAAVAKVEAAFQGSPRRTGVSFWLEDADYDVIHKLVMNEKSAGVVYASKDSAFMDNQAIRKLFQTGVREFPGDYWADSLRGKDIPTTKNGKCGLGDFKLKKGLSVGEDGQAFVGQGEGNHPLAGKSGYFAGLQKHTSWSWPERPEPVDPQGWLAGISG